VGYQIQSAQKSVIYIWWQKSICCYCSLKRPSHALSEQCQISWCLFPVYNSGMNNWSHNVRRFYGQFNNIMSVLGKGYYEMTAIHLLKTYCLPMLMYASENSVLVESDLRKITVIWNNCFRHIFSCCWRDSVRPLQMFCHTLPLSHLIDQSKLLFWKNACK